MKQWEKNLALKPDDQAYRYEGIDIYRRLGENQKAEILYKTLKAYVDENQFRFNTAEELILAGRFALDSGQDPSSVLKKFYQPAVKANPDYKAAYLFAAELAFSKEDNDIASQVLQRANQRIKKDPDIILGLVKAFSSSDSDYANALMQGLMKQNPNFPDALLYQLEQLLLKDKQDESLKLINHLTRINPNDYKLDIV